MTHDMKHKLKVALSTALLAGATAVASNVTLPTTFTPNTPARAAEVNANFSAVKTAVDDNHGRLQSVETQLPPLASTVAGLSTSVNSLGTRMQSVETQLSPLATTVSGLNTTVTTLSATTWRRTGNLGTNPATDYIGTADNNPLDLRVNAARVVRIATAQVGVNTTNLEPGAEMVISANDTHANLMLKTNQAGSGGYLFSVGDPLPTTGQANFYLDSYRTLGGTFFQNRRLRIDDLGRLAINRGDTFVGGALGSVPLMVGSDTTNGNGAYLTMGGTWVNASSRQFKHALQAVNTAAILEKVVALPMNTWEYKDSTEGRHLGPMAEDFSAAFRLGQDAQRIASVDESGVALAAIQGLNQKLELQNAQLRHALEALEARLAKLER